MRSVYQVAEDSDYDILLTLVGENETRPVERLLDNRKIDGLILTRTLEKDPLVPLLKARGLPFVAIGRPEDESVLSVDHDQVGGCREMTSLLLMKGMQRIALLGGSMLYTVNQTRLAGYRQAHEECGCPVPDDLLFLELETWSWKPTNAAVKPSARPWPARPTACFAWTTTLPCWRCTPRANWA